MDMRRPLAYDTAMNIGPLFSAMLAIEPAGIASAPPTPSILPVGVAVVVTNSLSEARASETVVLPIGRLKAVWPGIEPKKAVVFDAAGVPVLSQWVDMDGDETPDELVFQANFSAGETRAWTVKPGTRAVADRDQFRVYGRFNRERHDDFAWENDRIANRVYGPDLETWKAEPLTSSGVDVWCKRVRRLVVNDWYMVDNYHQDTGEGADLYSVKGARGCGGIGVWTAQNQLAVSRNFTNSRVLANGPIRLVFELTYAPWDVGGRKVSETKRVILDAGENFDRFESTFRQEAVSAGSAKGEAAPLALGIGIARHEGGVFEVDKDAGWLRSWEPLKMTPKPQSLGCAVVVGAGAAVDTRQTDLDQLLIVKGRPGTPVVYYAGHGWDGNGDFADRASWNHHVDAFTRRVATPIQVAVTPIAPAAKPVDAKAAQARPGVKVSDAKPSAPQASDAKSPIWAARMCDAVMGRSPILTDKWNYEAGLLLKACLDVWATTKAPRYLAYVRQSVDRVLDDDGNPNGYKNDDYNLDNINMGKVLFRLLAAARDAGDSKTVDRYTKTLKILRAQMRQQPRTTDGAFWHKLVYPRQMWLDGVYMASPFLAEYANVFHEPELLDEAVRQVVLAEKHMRDAKTGLLFHGWDESHAQRWSKQATGTSPHVWGRALGWYAMAVVDILEQVDAAPHSDVKNGARREALLGVLRRLASALGNAQDRTSGVWWQVLSADRAAPNYPEASASAMFTYALSKSVRRGWLDAKKFGPIAKAGFEGIVKMFVVVDASGGVSLQRICKVAGLGGQPYRDGSLAYYTSTELAVNDLKGVGPFIMASLFSE